MTVPVHLQLDENDDKFDEESPGLRYFTLNLECQGELYAILEVRGVDERLAMQRVETAVARLIARATEQR